MSKTALWGVMVLCTVLAGCPFFAPPIVRDGSVDSDLAVMNAKIFTSNMAQPWAEAVAIKDQRIVYVGDDDGLKDFLGPNTRIVNARGKMLTPGFIDSHTHAVWLGILYAVMTNIYAATSVQDIKEEITSFAQAHPTLPFVMGIGWKYSYVPTDKTPLEQADAILEDRPLILWSHDGHTGWVNTLMLERMQSANPDAFQRLTPEYDANEQLSGRFLHFYAINPFDFFPIEELGDDLVDAMAASLTKLLDEGLAVGVTAHHDVMIHRPVFDLLTAMRDRGAFDRARARCAFFLDQHVLEHEAQLLADLDAWKGLAEESSPHLIMGGSIKLGVDGVSSNHTSFVYEPYADTENNCGLASWSQEDFDRITKILDDRHFQICTHAVGDAGINRVINSYEALRQQRPDWDARHTIEHCSLVLPADMQRMAALDIHASMQPAHAFSDPTIEATLGLERLCRQHPCHSLQDAGVNLAFGTDYSIVPMNPILTLLVASTRLNYHFETNWGPEEAVSIEDAIRQYTIGSARTQKLENDLGSIEVGKYGDFVLFDFDLRCIDNPLFLLTNDMESGKLDRKVIMTVVDGKIVYYRDGETCKAQAR